jgi:enoyl-CoA hydratase/carnithine racemase
MSDAASIASSSAGVRSAHLGTMFADVRDGVWTLTLNRPSVLNCIDEAWLRDFQRLLDEIQRDTEARVVVIRGAGRAFCTGIDLTALSKGQISSAFFRQWEEALWRLETLDAIVIAAVHAHCIGGGLQLALACDLRLARTDARFGITAVKEGIIPGIGVWRIARHAGLGRAKWLALTGEVVDAATALQWGLVQATADEDVFEARLASLISRMGEMAWTSTKLTKKLANIALDTSAAELTEMFCEFQRLSTASSEHQRAMRERREARSGNRGPLLTEICVATDANQPVTGDDHEQSIRR